MTEKQVGGPGPRTTFQMGDLILGEARTGVFLDQADDFAWTPGKSPWSETLFWKPLPTVFPSAHKDSLPSKNSPLLLNQGSDTQEQWLAKASELWTRGHHNLGLLTTETDLALLSPLLTRQRLPLLVRLQNPGEALTSLVLGLLACGVQGVITAVETKEVWEELYPQVKSLVFSLEKELIRPPSLKISSSSEIQNSHDQKRVVGFQGERGAYSELAVFSLFDGADTEARPFKAFRDVYEAVLKGDADYGLLPLENALAGSIHDNFDLLLQYPDLHIIAETQIRIEHNLIGLPGASLKDIKKVLSHPQGLAQSAAFLDLHPDWEKVPFYDTAGSVAHIAILKDPSLAAIASAVAAKVYGMEILKSGVETNPRNFTRFALIAPQSVGPLGPVNKASLVFSTAHSPGALSDCLAILSRNSLNMRKIESRPIHGKPWSYMFYIDVEVPPDPDLFEKAKTELTEKASEFRLLGIYPSR